MKHRPALLMITLITLFLVVTPLLAEEGVTTITIPDLDIEARIVEFPLNGTGWEMNPWEEAVGHLQGTAWMGEGSNIALGGHSTMPDLTPGIFFTLNQSKIGNVVNVRQGSQTYQYTITSMISVTPDDLSILYPTHQEQLTLITCDVASYNPDTKAYDRRLVVTAERTK